MADNRVDLNDTGKVKDILNQQYADWRYVKHRMGATRARENLYFTYPSQIYDHSAGMLLNRPSRFIDMLPDDILEHRSAEYMI